MSTTYVNDTGSSLGDIEPDVEIGDEDRRRLIGLFLGGRRQRRKIRALLLAELLRSGAEGVADDSDDDDADDMDVDDAGRKLAVFLIGRRAVRRRKLRRALLAALLGSASEAGDEDDDDDGDDDGFSRRALVKLLIGNGIRRRQTLRKIALSRILDNV